MRFLLALIIVILLEFVGVIAFAYSGAYNVGADVADMPWLHWFLSTTSEHSVEARAGNIRAPALDDPALVAEGAKHYAEMCTGCHLAPGKQDSELRKGLNPKPPNLTLPNDLSPGEAFWVIKHGIRMTAMPAWGLTHDDAKIWSLVAFVRRLPSLSPDEYRQMTAGAGAEEMHEHEHDAAQAESAPGTEPADAAPSGDASEPAQKPDEHAHEDAGGH